MSQLFIFKLLDELSGLCFYLTSSFFRYYNTLMLISTIIILASVLFGFCLGKVNSNPAQLAVKGIKHLQPAHKPTGTVISPNAIKREQTQREAQLPHPID